MKKIVGSTERWIGIVGLALGAAALLLEKPLPGLQRTFRGNDFVYPFYNSPFWSKPSLVSSGGVPTWKRWAVGLMFGLSLIEMLSTFVVAIACNTLDARRGDIFGNFLVLSWVLALPSFQELSIRNQPA